MNMNSICQSCSMPMEKESSFGTTAGGQNMHYCCYCYQQGEFTNPDMTVDQMIEKVVAMMVQLETMSLAEAQEFARNVIPELKRWHN